MWLIDMTTVGCCMIFTFRDVDDTAESLFSLLPSLHHHHHLPPSPFALCVVDTPTDSIFIHTYTLSHHSNLVKEREGKERRVVKKRNWKHSASAHTDIHSLLQSLLFSFFFFSSGISAHLSSASEREASSSPSLAHSSLIHPASLPPSHIPPAGTIQKHTHTVCKNAR